MSFYTYFGKLENELLVAVLPNGTVEHDDPIYIYTKKKFSSYKAKDVSVSEDGEDVVVFNDGYYTYEAVSKRSYRELSLNIKTSDGKSSKVTLERLYDLPISAVPFSDPPKIWTGAIDFHKWAKNQSFIAITPKGLGNGKPVVCLWQWTEDSKGTPRTLSTSVGTQASDASSPTTFSFKQNEYYALNCKVNAATSGLQVTVKSPSNPDATLKELALSAKIELGAEHSFAPPRPAQHKITLDCSHPRTTPSLPRITGALPFPADLIETLTYSAAYVDQAGYLAKFAVKQFDQLDKSFHQLEKKSEARLAKIEKLESEVKGLSDTKARLTSENGELKKQLDANRQLAEQKQTDLGQQLKKALDALAASQRREKSLKTENEKLKTFIEADKLADVAREMEFTEREREHSEHDAADHKALEQAHQLLEQSRERETQLCLDLEKANAKITKLEADLKLSNAELSTANVTIRDLTAELAVEKEAVIGLKSKLENETYLRANAEKDLVKAQEIIAEKAKAYDGLESELKLQESANTQLEEAKDVVQAQLKASKKKMEQMVVDHDKAIKKLEDEVKEEKAHNKTHHGSPRVVDFPAPKPQVTVTSKEIVA
jgi:hypothetical protein